MPTGRRTIFKDVQDRDRPEMKLYVLRRIIIPMTTYPEAYSLAFECKVPFDVML